MDVVSSKEDRGLELVVEEESGCTGEHQRGAYAPYLAVAAQPFCYYLKVRLAEILCKFVTFTSIQVFVGSVAQTCF